MSRLGSLSLLFVFLVLASCDDGVQRSYWDNGKLKSELRYVDGRLNGVCVWYDSNGWRQTQACYRNDTLEGQYLRWYQSGQLAEERWYKNGMQDSICRIYSEKGNLASEDHYVGGKLNGETKKWYDNGQVFQEGQYVDGMMDGMWLIFYPSGVLASKAEYRMGTGKQVCYDESGYKCLEVSYANNQKNGREVYYNPDGRVTKIVEYENGVVFAEDNDPQNAGF